MEYKIINATEKDIKLINRYRKDILIGKRNNITKEEKKQINDYINESTLMTLKYYKIIVIDDKKVGCLLLSNQVDGKLFDELYLENEYRNKGIGSKIINEVLENNNIVYLWVYKDNTKAINLYNKLGFEVIMETKTRYYMKYEK